MDIFFLLLIYKNIVVYIGFFDLKLWFKVYSLFFEVFRNYFFIFLFKRLNFFFRFIVLWGLF